MVMLYDDDLILLNVYLDLTKKNPFQIKLKRIFGLG